MLVTLLLAVPPNLTGAHKKGNSEFGTISSEAVMVKLALSTRHNPPLFGVSQGGTVYSELRLGGRDCLN